MHCHKCSKLPYQYKYPPDADPNRWDRVTIWEDGHWLHTTNCPKHARWWSWRYWTYQCGRRIGKLSSLLVPGFGWCERCLTNWHFVEHHTTWYSSGTGMFALCEDCWQECNSAERVPYYRVLFERWSSGTSDQWNAIKSAVLSEQITFIKDKPLTGPK